MVSFGSDVGSLALALIGLWLRRSPGHFWRTVHHQVCHAMKFRVCADWEGVRRIGSHLDCSRYLVLWTAHCKYRQSAPHHNIILIHPHFELRSSCGSILVVGFSLPMGLHLLLTPAIRHCSSHEFGKLWFIHASSACWCSDKIFENPACMCVCSVLD